MRSTGCTCIAFDFRRDIIRGSSIENLSSITGVDEENLETSHVDKTMCSFYTDKGHTIFVGKTVKDVIWATASSLQIFAS